MWSSSIRKPEMPICCSMVPETFYWHEARPPTDEFPQWWKSNCLGKSLPKIYVIGLLWNKEELWMYLTGRQAIQHILTSHCIRSRSNEPQLPGGLFPPYHNRNDLQLKVFGLSAAPFCHGGASMSAKDFIMLKLFTGEGSNEIFFLHPTA